MDERITGLVRRVTDLAAAASQTAQWAAITFLGAALVLVAVLRLEPGLGFGWAFPGWWVPALLTLGPAIILFVFAMSAGRLARIVDEWPDRLAGAADTSLDVALELAGSTKAALTEQRGLGRLAHGVWSLRRAAGEMRGLFGDAAPAFAAFTPSYLLLTLIGLVAGGLLSMVAGALVLLRIAM
ncbi:MAG TPA: hypothetical protein VLG28_18360 [Acidimicrobiia bacterium]|jgi:hypothetical protein|nr:hypothetical protein [Acidimicrobiia bacterium]